MKLNIGLLCKQANKIWNDAKVLRPELLQRRIEG